MEFLYGFFGALIVIGVLGAGIAIGWKAHGIKTSNSYRVSAEKLNERERDKLIEQQRAFHAIQSYGPEVAYGMSQSSLPREE